MEPVSMLLRRCLVLLVLLAAAPLSAADYRIDYRIGFDPDAGLARVVVDYRPGEGRVSRFDFNAPAARYRNAEADGSLVREGGRLLWEPPEAGGSLRMDYRIDRRRRDGGYDARITPDWVIVRGDHLVPAAVVTASRGAESRAQLHFDLPEGWSVETGWPRSDDARFEVENPERRFSRPTGWMVAGDIGVRREQHPDTEVVVAGPRNEGVRRNEILGVTNLVLPEMREAFGSLPPKILIVSAGDPMWRGGLSGPNSLYMHAERPLISENGTSTLVHELVHMVTRIAGTHEPWIAEGTAEFYALELLRRVGLISEARHARGLDWMRERGSSVRELRHVRAHGPVTARAVTLFADLDAELREASGGEADLDALMRALMEIRAPTLRQLQAAYEALAGRPSQVLQAPELR